MIDDMITVVELILLCMIRSTVNKCNARNTYPANHKISVIDTSICSSIPNAK
jgi:hypothetical protein